MLGVDTPDEALAVTLDTLGTVDKLPQCLACPGLVGAQQPGDMGQVHGPQRVQGDGQ